MMVDTTVYGYIGDGFALCTDCAAACPEEELARHEMTRVDSHDDDGEGMSCDECGTYIFEPEEDGNA